MTALLDAMMAVSAKLDNMWSMYIVVHLGLLWFLFLVHRPLLISERLVAFAAYAGFVIVNGSALVHAYALSEALRSDLVTRFARELAQAPQTLQFLSQQAAGTHPRGAEEFILLSHGLVLVVITLLLLFRNTMIRRYYELYPEVAGKKPLDD